MRFSGHPRREPTLDTIDFRRRITTPLDIDILTIKTTSKKRRQGCASLFIMRLIEASCMIGRGVYLEQTITPGSILLANSLVKKNILFPYSLYEDFDYNAGEKV